MVEDFSLDIPGTVEGLYIDDGTGPVRNPAVSDADFNATLEATKASNIAALWEAAHNYEVQRISGSAVSMLALGVGLGKPKALAVFNWIQILWDLYYERKALVTSTWNQDLYDFTVVGPMPHSVTELKAETTT